MADAKLTDAERNFIDSYFHEHMGAANRPAMNWLGKHGLMYPHIASMVLARGDELRSQGFKEWPRPSELVEIPWRDYEEFRLRMQEFGGPITRLTEKERLFVRGYLYELRSETEKPGGGPACAWLKQYNLADAEMLLFTERYHLESPADGEARSARPTEYLAPWASAEEFRRRAAELKEALHELQPQPQVDDNVQPSSTEEPNLPEDEPDGIPCVAVRRLTEQERLFIAGYQYEMTGAEDGPATVGWLVKHNLSHADMHLFTMQLTMELDAEDLPYPPRPAEYPIPWASLEEFRVRQEMLREIHNESRSEAKVGDNVHRRSAKEPDGT